MATESVQTRPTAGELLYEFLVLRAWLGKRLDLIEGDGYEDPLTYLLPGANEIDGDTIIDASMIDAVYSDGDKILKDINALVERMRVLRQNHLAGIIAAAEKQLAAEFAGEV